MKKSSIVFLFFVIASALTYSQVKVNIAFSNARLISGIATFDIVATVQPGQTWRVGSSNIRVDWVSVPPNAVSVRAENPAYNANSNISNPSNPNYSAMTTTSISGGTYESLNITRLANCYTLSTGTYTLGSIRFNVLDSNACIRLSIRTNSVMQDSITALSNPANWTLTVDTTCRQLRFLSSGTANNELPMVFKLYTNYPNPFNPSTTIKYDVPREAFVTLTIYDLLGREVDKLVNGNIKPGRYSIIWNAANYASGTYFYRFESDFYSEVKKMSLIK